MFSRLASALYSAVDALAPPLPLCEEVEWHWNAITKFYVQKRVSSRVAVEDTNIPSHFEQMSSILEQEEKELESESMGASLEYVLQHKVLDTAATLARADAPLGIKKHVLLFVGRLLSQSRHSLLPHISVYTSVLKLVSLCGEIPAAPLEKEEMRFLCIVCDKINSEPQLMNCFVLDAPKCTSGQDATGAQSGSSRASNGPSFPLLKSLLMLLQSPDTDVSVQAGECLIRCVSVLSDGMAEITVKHTSVCETVVKQLVPSYHRIPRTLNPSEVVDALKNWGHDGPSLEESEHHISPGIRKLLCFFRWFDFLDMFVSHAHSLVGKTLAVAFQSLFLEDELLPDLVDQTHDSTALLATVILSSCLRHVNSIELRDSINEFLLGKESETEVPGCIGHMVKHVLIDRCRNVKLSLQLGMSTLQLFEDLLHSPTEMTLQNLVMANVINRGYHDHTAVDCFFTFSDDEQEAHRKSLYEDFDISPGSSPVSRTFAPTFIHKILNCFLLLVPDEIKSCTEEESGYDEYINDTHRQFQEILSVCEKWDWPTEPLCNERHSSLDDDASSDSQPEADSACSYYYEGSFLGMIFDNLEQMLEQPYEVNLQVTSLISRLALFPHPNLHEYLLNPLIPLSPGVRSLFLILINLVEDIQVKVQRIPGFKKKLRLTRDALLSGGTECSDFEHANVLEALIVIEEFCKELAAVAFVKYHAAI